MSNMSSVSNMSLVTPQKLLVIGLVLGWLAAVAVGFVAYHDARIMKFFLAMNFLMLAYTILLWFRG